jgi:CRISPR system Cascade subunit CasA
MSFNLLQEPWIPVVNDNWKYQELSLLDFFRTWQNLREIQADNPPTTLAIYRLLLAIMHSAYQGPKNIDHWEEIQLDDGKKAIEYLEKWHDRFDIFHPEYPFMQDLALTEDKAVPIYAIHTMSTSTVFSHEHEFSGYAISLPEAARLLVRLQSVDITSLRAFYPKQTSGNRSAVNTPTINNANVLIVGRNLKSTLMMNLMQYDVGHDLATNKPAPLMRGTKDLPSWEVSYAGKPTSSIPNAYISYLTYPWRRLNLFRSGDLVDRIAITMGNSIDQSFEQWECGLAFKDGKPIRISPKRQLWRNSHSFLRSADKESRPQIVEWVANLAAEELVDKLINLQIFGMCADKAKPLAWSVESFAVSTIYIQDKNLSQRLKDAVDFAEEHREIFRYGGGSPYHALAKIFNPNASAKKLLEESEKLMKSLDGESRYWSTLDPIFLDLLKELPKDKEQIQEKLSAWKKSVQKAASNAFTDSIESIRNYEARAKALQALGWKLADLRLTPVEREERKAKAKAKKAKNMQKEKVSI